MSGSATRARRADVANRNLRHNKTPPYLLSVGFHRSLSEQAYLEFAHGAFQPEQKPVVQQTGIVDAIVIDDQRSCHGTEIDQMVPVAVVPCQT